MPPWPFWAASAWIQREVVQGAAVRAGLAGIGPSHVGLAAQLCASGDHLFLDVDFWGYDQAAGARTLRSRARTCRPSSEALCSANSQWFSRIQFGDHAASAISSISVSVVNGPDADTRGIDLRVEYVALAGWCEWSIGFAGTRTLVWDISGWNFGPAYDALGRLNYDTSLARTVLDWKGRLWPNAEIGDSQARWTAHYLHDGATESPIDSHLTHDLPLHGSPPKATGA